MTMLLVAACVQHSWLGSGVHGVELPQGRGQRVLGPRLQGRCQQRPPQHGLCRDQPLRQRRGREWTHNIVYLIKGL